MPLISSPLPAGEGQGEGEEQPGRTQIDWLCLNPRSAAPAFGGHPVILNAVPMKSGRSEESSSDGAASNLKLDSSAPSGPQNDKTGVAWTRVT